MNQYTRVFLILLRLAIGWHFLVEGFEKIESMRRGPTDHSKPWSSQAYLQEATGPLAGYFRQIPGDPDKIALDRLTSDEKAQPPRNRVPIVLEKEWSFTREAFKRAYKLDEQQSLKADQECIDGLDRVGKWLTEGVKEVEKSFPSGSVKVTMTTPERVADYRAKWLRLREVLEKEMPAFEQDVQKAKLNALKGDVRRMRLQLMADLDEHRMDFVKRLQALLTDEQKKASFTPPGLPVVEGQLVAQVDVITAYGLTAVGACLLLGLFSRLAAAGGAGFLLLFYLAMPPWPGLPDNPRVEGHYLYVNKNLIEMLALLVLASVPTGRWVGLDGLIHWAYRSIVGSSTTETNPAGQR